MAHEKTGSAKVDRRDPPAVRQYGRFGCSLRGGTNLQVPLSVASARVLFLCLIGIEIALAGVYLAVQLTEEFVRWGPIRPLFNLDGETSLPTWFSTIQLFIISVVLLLIVVNNRQPQRLPNWLLLIGATGFTLLSVDEGAQLHERIKEPVVKFGPEWIQFPGGYGDWIIPYLLLCLVALVVLVRPLASVIRNYPREALIAIGGAIVIVLGAVGLEAVSYFLREDGGVWYAIEVAGEEFAEMAGASMILYAALLPAIRTAAE